MMTRTRHLSCVRLRGDDCVDVLSARHPRRWRAEPFAARLPTRAVASAGAHVVILNTATGISNRPGHERTGRLRRPTCCRADELTATMPTSRRRFERAST